MATNSAMTMYKGTSKVRTITVLDKENRPADFTAGDKVTFTLKKNVSEVEPLLVKTVTTFEGNKVKIIINPTDTAAIPITATTSTSASSKYIYDVILTRANGDVIMLVTPSEFTLLQPAGIPPQGV